MIRLTLYIQHLNILCGNGDGWSAVVKRSPQQFIHMLHFAVNSRQRPIILHAYGNPATICIGKSYDCNRKSLRIYTNTLSVEHLKFCRGLYICYCHIILRIGRMLLQQLESCGE